MTSPRFVIAILLVLFIISTGCQVPDESGDTPDDETIPAYMNFTPPEEGYPTEDALVCTIYFFTGENVGDFTRTTGPHMSTDSGESWSHMAWESIITNAIAVGPYGKWVYCSCGNGVLASSDGGRNWRVTGGWQMAEVQDVKISQESPLVAWAAGAYGLYYTEDGAETWTIPGDPQPFRYCQTVCIDRDDPDHILVGTEIGLFESLDRGINYVNAIPDFPVRSILQDSRDPEVFWIGTDGGSLWRSDSETGDWIRLEGPHDVINEIQQHPETPEWIYCGMYHGFALSLDAGDTWHTVTDGFGEFSPVYAIQVDTHTPTTIYAGARDGFYYSVDSGYTWQTYTDENGQVLRNAVIFDLWQGELYRGDEEPGSTEPGTLVMNTNEPVGDEFRGNISPGFEDRRQMLIDEFASRAEERIANLDEGRTIGPFQAISLIKEGKTSDALWDSLRERYESFGHSMFDSFPAMSLYLFCRDELPEDIREMLRVGLVETVVYRGDTENHWLMYHTALLLACQEWPETSQADWYTGRTTQQNYDDAIGWIHEWARITTTIGQGEFDSPHYFNTYLGPSLLLYEFAQDPVLKREIGMILDLLLADMAAESLEGRYGGGHSRMYDPTVVQGSEDHATGHFYLYFGGCDMPEYLHAWILNGVYGSYRCPEAIADIALRRDIPYVHTEVKRVRNQMRYSEMLNSPVYKYAYMTPDYVLGSLQGGILQPIQQHTWDITWIGSAENTTLFSLHPYYSPYELAMFFPEDPHMLTASVQAQKGTYTNPQKLNSSSPFERVFQHEDTLLAVYNIPEGTTHEHVTLYVPDCINHTEENGWIFGSDGNTFIAVYPCTDGEWYDEPVENFPPAQRMQIPAGQTAIVAETGRTDVDGTFNDFKNAILENPVPVFETGDNGPSVVYTNRHDFSLSYSWEGDRRMIDGELYEFPSGALFAGPCIEAEAGTRVISFLGNDTIRTLDFNELTISQTSE